jgi:SAM-dependent methyltransferase
MTADPDSDARRMARFFEIFESVPRGGPGDPASTGRALAMMADLPAQPRVLDLGCGPGAGSSNLADLTGGRVTALDLHAPFVGQQAAAARAAGLSRRLDPLCADMRAAPFLDGAFDLVWSEGALYSIGFRQGLDLCARLVRPGGYVAASEVVWTVDAPPDQVYRWWTTQYADIASIDEKASIFSGAGLEIVGHFTLPREAWASCFYEPVKARLVEFRRAWSGDAIGLEVLAEFDAEIEMYERWGHTYGYEFFIARRSRGQSRL